MVCLGGSVEADSLPVRGGEAGVVLGDEVDAEFVSEGVGDSGEHVEAVAVVIGVLQATDDGLGRPDPVGQVLLAQTGRSAEGVDLLGDSEVVPLSLQRGEALLAAFDVSSVKDSDGVGRFPASGQYSSSWASLLHR